MVRPRLGRLRLFQRTSSATAELALILNIMIDYENDKVFKKHLVKDTSPRADSRMVITSYNGLIRLAFFSILLAGLYTPLEYVCWILLTIWLGWICLPLIWGMLSELW